MCSAPSLPQLGQAHFWLLLHKAAHGSNKAWAHACSSGGSRKATPTCTHACMLECMTGPFSMCPRFSLLVDMPGVVLACVMA